MAIRLTAAASCQLPDRKDLIYNPVSASVPVRKHAKLDRVSQARCDEPNTTRSPLWGNDE